MGMAGFQQQRCRRCVRARVAVHRDTKRRSEVDFGGWNDWDKKLSAMTDELYALNGELAFQCIKGDMVVEGGPGIDFAMRKYAREHKLPC